MIGHLSPWAQADAAAQMHVERGQHEKGENEVFHDEKSRLTNILPARAGVRDRTLETCHAPR
jgi:hypothetical protein